MTGIEQAQLAWRKSSYSDSSANCVEVGFGDRLVGARDSKQVGGPVLTWPEGSWTSFLHSL